MIYRVTLKVEIPDGLGAVDQYDAAEKALIVAEAAPDLLRELKMAETTIVDLLEIAGGNAKFKHNVLPGIRAAIAKAEKISKPL